MNISVSSTTKIFKMRISLFTLLTVMIFSAQFITAKVPVYIVAGQSNADGRALMEEMPPEIHRYIESNGAENIKMSYCYGSVRNTLGLFRSYVPMSEGENSDKCGFDAVLYSMIADSADNPIYVIKESKGGTAIDTACESAKNLYWNASPQWLADAGMAGYDPMTDTTNGRSLLLQLEANIDSCISTTLSSMPDGYEFKCIIWHQGESDRAQGERYYSNLKALVEHLRHHIAQKTGDESYLTLPFIAGGINKDSRQYNEHVENAKIRLAGEDGNFHYIDLDDCELRSDDNLHFNGNGASLAAKYFYECLKELDLLP